LLFARTINRRRTDGGVGPGGRQASRTVRITKALRLLRVLRMVRMLRMLRFPQLLQHLEEMVGRATLRMIGTLAAAFMLIHWVACIFYAITSVSHGRRNTWVEKMGMLHAGNGVK
jgi:hypothetical protein